MQIFFSIFDSFHGLRTPKYIRHTKLSFDALLGRALIKTPSGWWEFLWSVKVQPHTRTLAVLCTFLSDRFQKEHVDPVGHLVSPRDYTCFVTFIFILDCFTRWVEAVLSFVTNASCSVCGAFLHHWVARFRQFESSLWPKPNPNHDLLLRI